MPRQGKRKKGAYLVAIAVALIGVVAAVRWAKPKLFPDLTAEAADAYSRSDWPRTAKLANQRLKQKPEDPQALRLAARAAARQDRDQTAIAIYSRLDVGLMAPEDFFLMGRALSRTGQAEPAFKALETAQAEDPDHPETLDFLCRLYYQTDRYYAAEATALRLARNPAWEARAQLMLGLSRAELENPVGVVAALKRWLQLDPEGKTAAPDPVRPIQMLLARSLLKSPSPRRRGGCFKAFLRKGRSPRHPGC